jgi:hypothetical protein
VAHQIAGIAVIAKFGGAEQGVVTIIGAGEARVTGPVIFIGGVVAQR